MTNHINESFIRQRRNLMAVSLVLLFAEFAGVTITKVNFFGNELTISDPMAIRNAIWVFFFYWLWRYHGYFNALGDRGISRAFNELFDNRVKQLAFRKLLRDSQLQIDAQNHKVVYDYANIATRSYDRYIVNVSVYFKRAIDQANTEHSAKPYAGIVVCERVRLLYARAVACAYVMGEKHLFSEYLLPYLVAVVPVVYKLYALIIRCDA